MKKLLTGSGKATKKEVVSVLGSYISVNESETKDESDAVAVGIAWLKQKKLI